MRRSLLGRQVQVFKHRTVRTSCSLLRRYGQGQEASRAVGRPAVRRLAKRGCKAAPERSVSNGSLYQGRVRLSGAQGARSGWQGSSRVAGERSGPAAAMLSTWRFKSRGATTRSRRGLPPPPPAAAAAAPRQQRPAVHTTYAPLPPASSSTWCAARGGRALKMRRRWL